MQQPTTKPPSSGAFKPTTQRLAAVQPSASTRRRILLHVLTKVTNDIFLSDAILDEAVREFGGPEVPEDEGPYEVFVRSYVVPRVLPHGSMAGVQQMIDRLLT